MKHLKSNFFVSFILLGTLLTIGYLYFKIQALEKTYNGRTRTIVDEEIGTNCVPTFRDGGGPYYKENSAFRNKIAPSENHGVKLVVTGKVLKNDCRTIVTNAVVDIWQANESGKYEDEWYRGKIKSDKYGDYSFETVVPKGYGEGTGYRPPHIHFKVNVDGAELVTSQMFFPEAKGKEGFDEAYIMAVESKIENGKTVHYGRHNIILP